MELTLKLTQDEAQIVLNAIAKEPYADVVNVINKIQKQAGEQIQKEEV